MSRNESDKTDIPNPEVVAQPTQRCFSDEYKLRILEEADRCSQPGELGALLRREGLYSSHLSRWRQARTAGQLAGLKAKKRGPKTNGEADLSKEVQNVEEKNVSTVDSGTELVGGRLRRLNSYSNAGVNCCIRAGAFFNYHH